jgi:diacylglycerol kinase family enzyme
MKAIALVNPAGGGAGEDPRRRVAAALRAAGVAAEVETVRPDQLAARAKAALDAGARLVIAAGGDGTVGAVAGVLAGTDAVLGILPLGTLNHLARDLGIPFDLGEAAVVIAAGHQACIDVARLNDRLFVNNSAIGLYPLFVADREGQQKLGRSKRLAMFVAGLRTLLRFDHHRLTLTVNGSGSGSGSRSATVETPLLFVGNNEYRLDLGGAGRRESLGDGKLGVIVMRRMGRVGLFAAMVRALAGRGRTGDMIRLDDVRRLTVTARRPRLTVSSDGETARLAPPLDYRIEPAALRVVVPAPARGED